MREQRFTQKPAMEYLSPHRALEVVHDCAASFFLGKEGSGSLRINFTYQEGILMRKELLEKTEEMTMEHFWDQLPRPPALQSSESWEPA